MHVKEPATEKYNRKEKDCPGKEIIRISKKVKDLQDFVARSVVTGFPRGMQYVFSTREKSHLGPPPKKKKMF